MNTIPLLHYEDRGPHNGPVVVLLHGYLASSRYWRTSADVLARNHRVISLDLLGFGQSPKPWRSRYDYKAHVASINATLNALTIDKPFVLVGHSMGALLALRYSRQHADRVNKLILANMPISLSRSEAKATIFKINKTYRYALRRGLHAIIWPLFRLGSYFKVIPLNIKGPVADQRSFMFQSTGISRLRSLHHILFNPKLNEDLSQLKTETVILNGSYDRLSHAQNLDHFKANPALTIKQTEAGHHIPQTQPNLISQVI